MKNEIINGGFIWRDSLDKYQEAQYYQQQAKKPDSGITARQIKVSVSRSRKVDELIIGKGKNGSAI